MSFFCRFVSLYKINLLLKKVAKAEFSSVVYLVTNSYKYYKIVFNLLITVCDYSQNYNVPQFCENIYSQKNNY